MQAYYMKSLPFQKSDGKQTSESRMEAVRNVLLRLVKTSIKLGFSEANNLSFNYKKVAQETVDEADRIHNCYIPKELFEQLLEHLEVESNFEVERDKLAMRIGYEMGLRTEELTRANNFSIKKLKSARLTWKFGEEIKWKVIGKGNGGGKERNVLIKPCMAERIFSLMDNHQDVYARSKHLFCSKGGKKLSAKHGTNIFYDAMHNFNHPEVNGKSFQKLRHSYATNLALWCIKNKIHKRLIQDRLGHESFSTTEIYIEVSYLINGDVKKSEEMRMVRLDRRKKLQKGQDND